VHGPSNIFFSVQNFSLSLSPSLSLSLSLSSLYPSLSLSLSTCCPLSISRHFCLEMSLEPLGGFMAEIGTPPWHPILSLSACCPLSLSRHFCLGMPLEPIGGIMANDRHTLMASLAPHVASKCDLHPHPQHSHPTFLHAKLHSRLPCTPNRVDQSGRQYFVDHCQCFAICDPHCITTHHTTSVLSTPSGLVFVYVCLPASLGPCAFFACDLLACTLGLID